MNAIVLDNKLIRNVLIGVVVIVIIVAIIWKWRSKSTYVYPENTPTGTFAVTGLASFAGDSTTPFYIKITTSAGHGFVASGTARDTVIFSGFTSTALTPLNNKSFILYPATAVAGIATQFAFLVSPDVIPLASVPASGLTLGSDTGVTVQTGYNRYKTLLETAVTTYNTRVNDSALGIYLTGKTNKPDSDAQALTDKQLVYKNASEEYVKNKCPYADSTNDYVDNKGKPKITNDPSTTNYNTYKLTSGQSISKITSDYSSFISASSTSIISGTNYSSNTNAVQQARKSDVTGATRMYLSSVCPGFYVDVDGSTIETTYKSWAIGSATYGFTKPTDTQINNWSSYAIDTSVAGSIVNGKLVTSVARNLKGETLSNGGVTTKANITGSATASVSDITSVSISSTTATITTKNAHGLASNGKVIMAGFAPSVLNGTYTVTAGSTTTFTITLSTATAATTATTLGVITPLVAATTATSPQLIVYTNASLISKPAWQWARDYGPGSIATALLPVALQGWATLAPASTTTMFVNTSSYS